MTATQESGNVVDLRGNGTGAGIGPAAGDVIVAEPTTSAALVTGATSPMPQPPAPSGTIAVRPKRTSDAATIVNRGLTTFSLLVAAMIAFLFVFSGLAEARAQVGLRRRFDADTQQLRAPIGGVIATGVPVAEIDAPDIGLHQIVVQGTTSGTLRAGPGHLRQSPLPGQQGNAVVFGRRRAYGGPFNRIGALSPGELITITTGEGQFTYVVDRVRALSGSDGSELVNSGTDQLTLVTSDPAFLASRRLVVTSHLRGTPAAASPDPTPVSRAELGLAGQSDGVLPLVLWLEVLLIVAVGATWLWRKWTRWPAYLVSVPVLLAVGWLVFENLAKLLPATL